ncbi:amino acid adenylation domain-containing protein [Sphaerothrix gracilis]|uniref:amino acid adenylation domain-containing protein n=1 Tax=Sphaerothrix gracilis TaxID=3151835 RepID=UPI0031FBD9C0
MPDLSQQLADLSPAQRSLLAKRLQQRGLNLPSSLGIPRRSPAAPANEAPLSFAQQRLWFIHQLDLNPSSYNVFSGLRLQGRLDVAVLEKALQAVVQRHDTLRTTFTTKAEGQPIQVIQPDAAVSLVQQDLTQAADPEQAAQQVAHQEARWVFDPTQPLLRLTLLKLAATEHLLLVTMHHIIADRWSLGLFTQELQQLYGAFSRQQPMPLAPLPIQYADFAVWQRQWLQGTELERQLSYWRQQLAALPVLDLPSDRPRPAVPTFQGAKYPITFAKPLSDALKNLSVQSGVTLFTVLLTAFKILLQRYSHQHDIVVGTDIANRNRVETEGLIGLLVNTLVLRTDLTGDPTCLELLQRVRDVLLGAYAHQDLPFERLVAALNPERNLSQMVPLFQVKFDLQLAPLPPLSLGELTAQPLAFDNETTKFELRLNLFDSEAGLRGQVEYSTDLFERSTIARLVGHFQTLLENLVACPQQRLSELSLLTPAEQHQLKIWNQTATEYHSLDCLHQQIERQVEQTPAAIALSFANQHLSYRELNSRANQLAHYLQAQGVLPDTPVGLCFERSLDLVVAILAVLKAGGAYVPLDPSYPSERLAFMLHDSQVPLLLTHSQLVATLPKHSAITICLDQGWPAIAALPTTNPTSAVTPAHLAYIIYTSGSTGQPKGAMNTHGALSNRLQWMQSAYGLTTADCVLQKTPFSFDVSVWEFLWPLMVGTRLAIARPEGHKDSAYLAELIEQQQVTTLHFVPSMLQAFLEAPDLERCACVRRVICSGEALPVALQERFLERLSAELHNLYGPTEAAIDVTAWPCQPEPELTSVPIGKPIANTQIYLLDRAGQSVPVGVPGELHIGGVGLARGYWQRAALTAEKFVPSPFAQTESGSRLYRTGDLARYRPDGAIEFLGRLDYQVKLRGFRIELGEIEAALAQHPEIRETVVTASNDSSGYQRLVAYGVYDASALSTSALRDFLAQSLPDYMIPSVFVPLDTLPLTPSGKVDRRALPPPTESRPDLKPDYVKPQTELEQAIAAIWQEVLQLDTVGIHDNFFELGGHSLLLIQVNTQLRQQLQADLSVLDLFRYPTIEAIATHLNQRQRETTPSDQSAVPSSVSRQLEQRQQGKQRMRQRRQKRLK